MADEYINKTELLFEMATSLIPQSMDITMGYAIAKDLIRKAPVADVAPVVHGEWIIIDRTEMFTELKCSHCGHKMLTGANSLYPNYCPNCGADMRGEYKNAK